MWRKEKIKANALKQVVNLSREAKSEDVQLRASMRLLEAYDDDFKPKTESTSKTLNIHAFIDATKWKSNEEVWTEMINFLRNSGD